MPNINNCSFVHCWNPDKNIQLTKCDWLDVLMRVPGEMFLPWGPALLSTSTWEIRRYCLETALLSSLWPRPGLTNQSTILLYASTPWGDTARSHWNSEAHTETLTVHLATLLATSSACCCPDAAGGCEPGRGAEESFNSSFQAQQSARGVSLMSMSRGSRELREQGVPLFH